MIIYSLSISREIPHVNFNEQTIDHKILIHTSHPFLFLLCVRVTLLRTRQIERLKFLEYTSLTIKFSRPLQRSRMWLCSLFCMSQNPCHVRCPAPLHSCQRREKEITLITTIRYLFRLDLEIILHLPSPREGEPETVKSHGRQSSLHSDIIITSSEVECFNRNHEWETSSLS